MSTKSTVKIAILVAIIGLIAACQQSDRPAPPDVSHLSVNMPLVRFEQELFTADTSQLESEIQEWYTSFPDFAPCYFESVIGIAQPERSWTPQLKRVLGFPGFRAAYDSVQRIYPDLTPLRLELEQAFRYHSYYHPDKPVPAVYTFISEYGYGAVACSDSVVGIGLDLFLGEDFSFYPALQFPQYLTKRMTREHILPSVMKVYWQSFLEEPGPGRPLLDHMLYYGKLLYYLDLVLPETPDRLKTGYTAEQQEWVETHEGEIWAYLLDKDRLYKTRYGDFAYLINEGPTTQGMPSASPGKVARWVGWQMVRAYRNAYPEESLDKLWRMTDGQAFLDKARYKPGR